VKTFSALGVYGAAVVTALTAQNTKGVFGIHDVAADFIAAQINAVFTDLAVGAVKIGMLGSPAAIDVVAVALERSGTDIERPSKDAPRHYSRPPAPQPVSPSQFPILGNRLPSRRQSQSRPTSPRRSRRKPTTPLRRRHQKRRRVA
jgi:hypothetical protein